MSAGPASKGKCKRSLWLSQVTAVVVFGIVQGAAPASPATDASLAKLEEKFFHTTYAKDALDARLDRLEKMVFGEAKDGDAAKRVAQLIEAVPNLNSSSDDGGEAESTPPAASQGPRGARPGKSSRPQAEEEEPRAQVPAGRYPAVSAIERKVFGKEFDSEPVSNRLARLETKVFGKPSQSTDLTDRTDRLKGATGIDVTKQPPPNADWADEDDDDTFMEAPHPVARSGGGEDGKTFSGRDLRQDMRKAFGMTNSMPRSYGGSGGMYGGGRSSGGFSSSGSSGMYGAGSASPPARTYNMDDEDDDLPPTPPPRRNAMPPVAPDRRVGARPPSGMGLSQQVTLMENEVFGKTYPREPLPERVGRLEKTLYPREPVQLDKPLPERVARLSSVVQISEPARSPQVAERPQMSQDFEDDDLPPSQMGGNSRSGQPRGGSGLGKIFNSISNLLSGGFAGGYPIPSANVITDPRTGLLLDTVTGNLIDPATGMVVGQRAVRGYGTGMGMGGFNSFNNGFAPGGFSIGGGGMRFGIGGGGMGMGYPRMWP